MKQQKRYGYATVGMVPVRGEASDAAEMVNQLLLGETFSLLDEKSRWVKLKSDVDGYVGWANRNEVGLLNQTEYENWVDHSGRRRSSYYSFRAVQLDKAENPVEHEQLLVPAGAFVVEQNRRVIMPHGEYGINDSAKRILLGMNSVEDTARSYLGIPYLWGGRSDAGIDCSGLIQVVLAHHGIHVPRDASLQFEAAPVKGGNVASARRGDLVYFNPSGNITHVGFYLGDGLLLHAQGYVRINTLVKSEEGRYSYHHRLANAVAGVQSLAAIKAEQ